MKLRTFLRMDWLGPAFVSIALFNSLFPPAQLKAYIWPWWPMILCVLLGFCIGVCFQRQRTIDGEK